MGYNQGQNGAFLSRHLFLFRKQDTLPRCPRVISGPISCVPYSSQYLRLRGTAVKLEQFLLSITESILAG